MVAGMSNYTQNKKNGVAIDSRWDRWREVMQWVAYCLALCARGGSLRSQSHLPAQAAQGVGAWIQCSVMIDLMEHPSSVTYHTASTGRRREWVKISCKHHCPVVEQHSYCMLGLVVVVGRGCSRLLGRFVGHSPNLQVVVVCLGFG